MEVQRLLAMAKRWWWLLLLGALLPMVLAFYVTLRQTPLYQARATLMVGTTLRDTSPDPMAMNTSVALARAYAELVKRRPIVQAVLNELGSSRSPEALAKQTTVSVLPEAQLLEIAVVDTDPQMAAALANALAAELIRQSPASGENLESRRAFVNSQLADLQKKVLDTEEKIGELQAALSRMTSAAEIQEAQLTLDRLQDVQAIYQSTYASLLASVGNIPNVLTLVEPAEPPGWPMGSKRLQMVALAGLVGLIMSSGAIVLLEYLDDRLQWEGQLQRSIAGLPVLGAVPRVSSESDLMILQARPESPEADAVRIFRTNILLAQNEKSAKSLLVTSSLPGEGKSVVAVNLAFGLAGLGRPVILVDGNLRNPSLHQILGLPNKLGLSQLLSTDSPDVGKALQRTSDPNLLFIAGGDPVLDPAMLLVSERAKKLFSGFTSALKGFGGLVVVDGPSILTEPEATLLASLVDGTVLIANPALVDRNRLEQARTSLEKQGTVRVWGLVLNGVRLPRAEGHQLAAMKLAEWRKFRLRGLGGSRGTLKVESAQRDKRGG